MKKIIVAIIAALLFSVLSVAPAHATIKKECNRFGSGDNWAKVCLKVRYATVAGHGSPDYHIRKVKTIYRSPTDDDYVGYEGMYNIDFSAREVVTGDWIHEHHNGRTSTRTYVDPHQFMCNSRHCRFTVDYTVDCGWLCPDPSDRITFVIRSGS